MTWRNHRHRLDRIEEADDELVYGGTGGMAERVAEVQARLATVTIIEDRAPGEREAAAQAALDEAHARLAAAEAVVADHLSGRWLAPWPMNRAGRDAWRVDADEQLERARMMVRVLSFSRR